MGDLISFPGSVQSANLYGLDLKVPVHPRASFIDHGDVIDKQHRELWGSCTSQYLGGKISVEVMVNGLLPKPIYSFARGHEEGHAIFYLGKLSLLREKADSLDESLESLKLDFLTGEYCSTHDDATERFFARRHSAKDYKIARSKPFFERESIANLGGLIALINEQTDVRILNLVSKGIKEGSLNPYPLPETIPLFHLL